MDDSYALSVLKTARSRFAQPKHELLVDMTFPEQLKFVEDRAMFVGAQCTRRAGKSNGIGFRLYRKALKYPGSFLPYIALTRESAKNIMWPVFREINEKYKLGASLAESSLTVTLPNESRIVCFGADMKNFINRLRGVKTPEAAVDEAQSFGGHIEELINDVLTPAISDYEDGAITLTGTPGPVPAGYYFDACHGKHGFPSVHKWSIYDNPYMPRGRKFVDDLVKKMGWTDQNPTYLREWCNQWVMDLNALVYKFSPEKNQYESLPPGHEWMRILSIDYGWNDQTAFGITTYSPSCLHSYTEWVEGHSEMIPSQIASRVKELRSHFNPYLIIADTGGLGKSITEEMIRRHGLPIEAAEKTEKLTAIHLLNGDYIDGKHFVHKSLVRLQDQYKALIKGEDHKEDPSKPNDLCDAVLYGHRHARNYLSKLRGTAHKFGSVEWAKAEADRMEREAVLEAENAETDPWWAK